MNKDDLKFNIDWLNGVLPITDFSIIEDFLNQYPLLNLSNWVDSPGRFNYLLGLEFSGMPGFRFCWNNRTPYQVTGNDIYRSSEDEYRDHDNNGSIPSKGEHNNAYVFLQLSGDGIRFLQKFDLIHDFFTFLYNNNFRCTRFDVNCDIFSADNEVVDVISEAADYFVNPVRGKPTFRSKYFRRQNKTIRVQQNYDFVLQKMTKNVTIGNHGSQTGMFRCYNKRVEVFETKKAEVALELWRSHGEPDYWYRLEYELHKASAESIFNSYMAAGDFNNIAAFMTAFDEFFDIVVFTSHTATENAFVPCWVAFSDLIVMRNIHFVQLSMRNEKVTNDEFIPSVELDKKFYLQYAGLIDCCMYLYDHDSEFRQKFDDRIHKLRQNENLRYLHRYARTVSGF